MGFRTWLEQAPAYRSLLMGAMVGFSLYFLPYGLEITIMIAMMMPGVYWGFAFCYDGTLELVQETIITNILAYFYFGYCLQNVTENPYCAPLSVLVHGLIDFWHHFRMSPSSDHVKACCHHYPIMCGCLDFAMAGTLALMIFLWG